MATQKAPVTPNFKDVDKETVQRAQALMQGGRQAPLTPPADARASKDEKKKKEYIRWTERITVNAAYRTVTGKGLMDIVIIGKIRQGEKNNGQSLFAHFYMNTSAEVSEGHEAMNDKTIGALTTALVAAELMPSTGTLKASYLAKMFPEKGKPGDAPSALVGKSMIANVVQQIEPAVDRKTNKPVKNEDGSPVMSRRDGAESFLPDEDDDEE